MSDEEIRDLLDLGAESMPYGPPIDAEASWLAGRRSRNTRRAWGTGVLAAAAALAAGVVWTQGLGTQEVSHPPAANPPVSPTGDTPASSDDTADTLGEDLTVLTGEPSSAPDPTTGEQEPSGDPGTPGDAGTPEIVIMSQGAWEPSGELRPLTAQEATGSRWLPVTTEADPPQVGDDVAAERGLSFDGTTWRIRDCGVDVSVAGGVQDGVLVTSGEPQVVPDPDPGAACTGPLRSEDWVSILTSEPQVSTDGPILVISGELDGIPAAPAALALRPEGTQTTGGGTTAVSAEELAGGLTEVPGATAAEQVGLSDVRDPQPEQATTLSVQDGTVTVDVGCAEPLQGPAWFSQVGPEEFNWQLTAALPRTPDCAGSAAEDAELWRQMLAQGAFLHHFEDYVLVDSWADPALGAVPAP